MAKDAKTRAKARVLYEAGQSLRDIANELGLDHKTVLAWSKKGAWKKGKSGPKLEQKAAEALEAEAERHGVTKGKVFAKIAKRLEAKMAVRITDSGSFSTVPLPAGVEVDEDGTAEAFGMTVMVTDDARTQDKALDQAIDVLGMKKEIVTVNPSDEMRKLWTLAKGQA